MEDQKQVRIPRVNSIHWVEKSNASLPDFPDNSEGLTATQKGESGEILPLSYILPSRQSLGPAPRVVKLHM